MISFTPGSSSRSFPSHSRGDALDPPDCVLVIGHGGSGTKRVVFLLDLARDTYCRFEPNLLADSPFSLLPNGSGMNPEQAELLNKHWDSIIDSSIAQMGAMDRLPPTRKRYQRLLGGRLAWRLVLSRRLRRCASWGVPCYRQSQWPRPRWLIDPDRSAHALPVIKLNKVPDWASWVLQHRPNTLVLHVVRHPAGYLHAWRNRWLNHHDPQQVTRANRARLRRIAAASPRWAERLGDIESINLLDSELLFWRYACETIHEAGINSPRYLLVKDEDVLRDPVDLAAQLYSACQLPWDPSISRAIHRHLPQWSRACAPWRELLSNEEAQAVKRILSTSRLQGWWDSQQIVSLVNYPIYSAGQPRPATDT